MKNKFKKIKLYLFKKYRRLYFSKLVKLYLIIHDIQHINEIPTLS